MYNTYEHVLYHHANYLINNIKQTTQQIILFTIGIIFSIILSFYFLPLVCSIEGLLWYILAIFIPILPSVLSLERF